MHGSDRIKAENYLEIIPCGLLIWGQMYCVLCGKFGSATTTTKRFCCCFFQNLRSEFQNITMTQATYHEGTEEKLPTHWPWVYANTVSDQRSVRLTFFGQDGRYWRLVNQQVVLFIQILVEFYHPLLRTLGHSVITCDN